MRYRIECPYCRATENGWDATVEDLARVSEWFDRMHRTCYQLTGETSRVEVDRWTESQARPNAT